ncbi:hypothetical protein GSI_14969 [Ganoderma sinense ZZ0214-1]|uniref:Uncharacterized protein n=1 Tax=Ganoderma sinense ZZ0214-1 TaxID=1077348 RepID=A0A2G8RQ76_9APHY|nr:hypothetical protein GSI_14969 [Ganoderma sinense ZZ0214-1]
MSPLTASSEGKVGCSCEKSIASSCSNDGLVRMLSIAEGSVSSCGRHIVASAAAGSWSSCSCVESQSSPSEGVSIGLEGGRGDDGGKPTERHFDVKSRPSDGLASESMSHSPSLLAIGIESKGMSRSSDSGSACSLLS